MGIAVPSPLLLVLLVLCTDTCSYYFVGSSGQCKCIGEGCPKQAVRWMMKRQVTTSYSVVHPLPYAHCRTLWRTLI